MITRLSGINGGMDDDGAIVVDVCGVGYGVVVSDRDRGVINARGVRSAVELFIRAVYREDSATLYGFSSADDRRAFDRIRRAQQLGPGVAMKLLSRMSAAQLKVAFDSRDPDELKGIPGIGKETARRLVDKVRL